MNTQPWENPYRALMSFGSCDVPRVVDHKRHVSAAAQLTSWRLFSCVCFGNHITAIFNICRGWGLHLFYLRHRCCLLPLMQARRILTMRGAKMHLLALWGGALWQKEPSIWFWDPVTSREMLEVVQPTSDPLNTTSLSLQPDTLNRHFVWYSNRCFQLLPENGATLVLLLQERSLKVTWM